ncbi:MAG: porin [Rhodoferax sp.]|nr:porin [Rhodoferax sp.]
MKKTLVALAVLATSGASFAQVTITGKLGYGMQRQPVNATAATPTANSAQGLLMTDGDILFRATEDLGGGMKITASSEIRLRGRDDTVAARNATLGLTTGFGLITVGAVEAVSPLMTIGMAGAPIELATNADANAGSNTLTAISSRANVDIVMLTVPVGSFSFSGAFGDISAGSGSGDLNGLNITYGQAVARYNAGPVSVYADYTNFITKDASPVKASFNGRDRYRVAGSYDFGMAKIGLGYHTANKSQPDEMSAGLTVPMGSVVFGLTYAQREAFKADATIGQAAQKERTFTGAGVQYNFSKMTNINLSYGTHTGPANYSDEYRVRLLKNF